MPPCLTAMPCLAGDVRALFDAMRVWVMLGWHGMLAGLASTSTICFEGEYQVPGMGMGARVYHCMTRPVHLSLACSHAMVG